MQTLWSRVAQSACTCRCAHCLRTARAIGRRANTGTANQIPRYFPSSTFIYSTLVAAAVTVEGARKHRRKEQWDAAIAQARKELETTSLDEEGVVGSFLGRSEEDTDALSILEAGQSPIWPENTGPALATHRLPPQSVYAPKSRKDRWTTGWDYCPKKVERIRLATDILQIWMWLQIAEGDETWDHAIEATDSAYVKKLHDSLGGKDTSKLFKLYEMKNNELERLHDASNDLHDWFVNFRDVRLCSYSQQHNERHQAMHVDELNRTLQKLFVDSQTLLQPVAEGGSVFLPPKWEGRVLAKIAHALYCSPAAPNVDTANTLLLGFYNSKCPPFRRLLPHVLTWLEQTKIRPNEITLEYALRALVRQDDAPGFARFVVRMLGGEDGLMLARSDIPVINSSASKRLLRHPTNGKIIQLPHATPSVMAAVVQGVLHFSDLSTAITLCREMRAQDWGVGMQALKLLLGKAAEMRRWDEGLAFWREMKRLREHSVMKYGLANGERITVNAYCTMLRLCRNCHQEDAYHLVLKSAELENVPHSELMAIMAKQDTRKGNRKRTRKRKPKERDLSEQQGGDDSTAPVTIPESSGMMTEEIESKQTPAEQDVYPTRVAVADEGVRSPLREAEPQAVYVLPEETTRHTHDLTL